MSATNYSFRHSLWQSLVTTKRPDVPLWVVLRNTAAVVLPLIAGMLLDHPQAGLAVAAGALDTMFSDQPGPYRQRLQQLLLASLAAGVAAFLGFMIGGALGPMLLATAAVGFFGGMLVVYGPDIARVGMTSMILLVVTGATPSGFEHALDGALLIVAGGLLLTLFSIAAWPLQRYRPERLALAKVYYGLATLARRADRDDDAPALTDAMNALQQTLLGRHHARGRAMEAFGVLLELAERMRLELVAMADHSADADTMKLMRSDAARVLDGIAQALDEAEPPELAERALLELQANEAALLDQHGRYDRTAAHIHALSGQLAAAVRNANWAGSRGEIRAAKAETDLPSGLRGNAPWALLRANLTVQSVALRHALRCAVCLSVAMLISRLWQLPHGYWLPMTAAIVLRPDFAATFNFGLLRVVGTLLGLLLTTGLLYITPHDPWAHLLLMAALCMAFRYLATAHYGIAVAALTGTVVIFLSFEGVESGIAVTDRVLNTVIGSGLALVAYVAWPTWERSRARDTLAAMLDAYAGYLAALAQPQRRDLHRDARTDVRIARSNAQASLDRMQAEPATPERLLELANALFLNGNRLARTSMSLEAWLPEQERLPGQAEVTRFVQGGSEYLHELATAVREQHMPAPAPPLRVWQRQLAEPLKLAGDDPVRAEQIERLTDRLVDNINTLAHIIGRASHAQGIAPAASATDVT